MSAYEKEIKERLREKQAKARKRTYHAGKMNEPKPRLTESELYYLYKNLYQRKENQ